jgi:hypothetical protein
MTDTTNTTNTTEEETMEEQVAAAEKTGVVNFNEKKQEKAGKSDNYTHHFSKPIEINGRKYETLTFYYDDLTGKDIEAVEQELEQQNIYVIAPEVSSQFQSVLAARAAHVPSDDIKLLPAKDYLKIKNVARNFLAVAGS